MANKDIVVKTQAKTKKGKSIGLTRERVEAIGRTLFEGIKVKNPKERKRIETERHHDYMDMVAQANGFNPVNPVIWTDALVKNITKQRAQVVIEGAIKDLSSEQTIKSLINKKNLVFYKNAFGYFRNKYGLSKKSGRQVQ